MLSNTSRVCTVTAHGDSQGVLTWWQGARMNQTGHHGVLDRNLRCPLLPQIDYTISFRSLKARTLLKSSYLAKPEVLCHISELLVVELTAKSKNCHKSDSKINTQTTYHISWHLFKKIDFKIEKIYF